MNEKVGCPTICSDIIHYAILFNNAWDNKVHSSVVKLRFVEIADNAVEYSRVCGASMKTNTGLPRWIRSLSLFYLKFYKE